VKTPWLLSGLILLACSQQGEGERCDLAATGNDSSGQGLDCADGLRCVDHRKLLDQSTDRCCPPATASFSDSRCRPYVAPAPSGTGGTGGTGGSTAGAAGTTAGAGGAAPTGGNAGAAPTAGAAGQGPGAAGTAAAGAGGHP